MKNFRGTFTALVTPFKNGVIDFKSLENLLKQQLAGGVNGFVVNGTTAESPTLEKNEVGELFKFIRSSVGPNVPLVVGTGSNSTAKTVEDSILAEKWGADALLVVVPYYNKPPQRGLAAHFQMIAEAVKIPVILYNVPGRTITSLETATISKLATVKNIVGIKEASGKIDFASEIISTCGSEFTMLSGDDGSYVDFLTAGGHGVISVATHVIPAQMVLWKKWVDGGQQELAKADIKKYSKLIDLLFCEANPIPVKKALQLMGVIETAELRLPMVELEETNTKLLKEEMLKLGLI